MKTLASFMVAIGICYNGARVVYRGGRSKQRIGHTRVLFTLLAVMQELGLAGTTSRELAWTSRASNERTTLRYPCMFDHLLNFPQKNSPYALLQQDMYVT